MNIHTLLISIPSSHDVINQRLLDVLSYHSLEIKTIPSFTSIINGTVNIAELSNLKIEDLLGREPVRPIKS